MANQALRLRKMAHRSSSAADDGIWVEGQLRCSRRRFRREGAAAYVAVPPPGQTLCHAELSLLRSRLPRFRHGRAGGGSLRNWTRCVQKAESRHA